MIFGNFNYLTLFLFLILLSVSGILMFLIYKRQKKIVNIFLLFLSVFFILISIFEIKGSNINNFDSYKGGKIVFIVDVSKSMNVQDISNNNYAISRLGSVKEMIIQFVSQNITNHYGLLIFAGDVMDVIPFTSDIGAFSTILYGVNDSNIAKYGTDLNGVLNRLENYFSGENDGGLAIIFSDGGDDKLELNSNSIDNLNKMGVKTIIVGVGTKSGGKIPIGNDLFGRTLYKSYNGKEVISSLNREELISYSKNHGFKYTELNSYKDFRNIENQIIKNIELIDLERENNNRTDLTRFFVFLSFIFFVLFLFFEHLEGIRRK